MGRGESERGKERGRKAGAWVCASGVASIGLRASADRKESPDGFGGERFLSRWNFILGVSVQLARGGLPGAKAFLLGDLKF